MSSAEEVCAQHIEPFAVAKASPKKFRNGWREHDLKILPRKNARFHNMLHASERQRMIDLGILDRDSYFTPFKRRLPRCKFGWVEEDTYILNYGEGKK